MKKIIMAVLSICMVSTILMGCQKEKEEKNTKATYPHKNVVGVVQWGAGGGTDSLMRPLASLAQDNLSSNIVIENRAGATGSIATQHVYDAKADGYTLLMGAENPQLYSALNILDLSYEDFEPILLIGDETVGVVVSKDSKFQSVKEIVEAAIKEPGTISMSTTGTGGLPWEVGSFMQAVTTATFKQVPYDSDATAKAAVLNGECDFTICKVQSGIEDYKAGTLNYLAMFATKPVAQLEQVPLITDEYKGFEEYLPWGPFYGVFVKKGTDQMIIDSLTKAFEAAYKEEAYQEVLKGYNVNSLGLTGEEATEYLEDWKVNTVTALYKSGAIEKTPEELGIEE